MEHVEIQTGAKLLLLLRKVVACILDQHVNELLCRAVGGRIANDSSFIIGAVPPCPIIIANAAINGNRTSVRAAITCSRGTIIVCAVIAVVAVGTKNKIILQLPLSLP